MNGVSSASAGYLHCVVLSQRDFWVVYRVLQNNPLWLVLTGLNKQYSSPDLECGLLRGGLWTRARQSQADFSIVLWVWGHTKWTARSIWELSAQPFGLQIITPQLLLFVGSLICSSALWMFWLKAFQPLLCTPHVHLTPLVIQDPRGVWVTSGMWDCFLFPDWRVGTFTGQTHRLW